MNIFNDYVWLLFCIEKKTHMYDYIFMLKVTCKPIYCWWLLSTQMSTQAHQFVL